MFPFIFKNSIFLLKTSHLKDGISVFQFWDFFGFTWIRQTSHQFNKMTTALELLKHTKTVIAKHRNLAHRPKAHIVPKLPAQ